MTQNDDTALTGRTGSYMSLEDQAEVQRLARAHRERWQRPGVYQKYRVDRVDGSSAPGGKHDTCWYFVLDPAHDPHAMPALLAYADACAAEYPKLAQDLREIATAMEP